MCYFGAKMVAVLCLVWPLALQLWSVRQAIRLKFEFWQIFFLIQPLVSVLLYLMLFYVLHGLVLFHKGDFHGVKCPLKIFAAIPT